MPTPRGWCGWRRRAQLQAVHLIVVDAPWNDPIPSLDWIPKLAGDCQGKTLWARETLLALGWPKDALGCWVCTTDAGRHAVLVVSVTGDDGAVQEIALDCRQGAPMFRGDLGYTRWTRALMRDEMGSG